CNQAAAKARGEYIFFLNNDTKVKPGWLSSLVTLLDGDDSIGMAGSRLVFADGKLQEAGGIIWSDASGWNYGRGDDPAEPEYNYVKDVDYISGAAICIRKSLWQEIGGFDERFAPAYCEDSDLAFEVRKHGKRVVYQPLSEVVHFEGVSNGTDVNGTGLKRYQVVNQEKFREKWKDELACQQENTGDPDPFTARDRSGNKKCILIVDHYVPTWDKDAGSVTTYQYIRMFVKQGWNVKFLGDNFLHEEPYTTVLTQMGVEVLYGERLKSGIWDWIAKNKSHIDVAYLNRPHIAAKYIDTLKDCGIRCIFYGHDLHYLRIRREYELTGEIRKKRESDYWKSLEYEVMEKAD
ncbi:MAG: glycosyltransferase family 2 protein, partial [Lachnospiraceae bacterium]|nr:glycosyltransferase family 2 protein [Candidatus Hippenecus merdae]